jgi:uroporphyrinogen-III synthase
MRVIVTRPATDGQVWAKALAAAGHEAVLLPLIEIAPAANPAEVEQYWGQLLQFQALMFVSANAVAGFFANKPAHLNAAAALAQGKLRAWATGPGTVRALLAHGVPEPQIDAPEPTAAQFDSEALWTKVRAQIKGNERVLIVRGTASQGPGQLASNAGRDWLASQLTLAGATVAFCSAYQRARPHLSAAQLAQVQRWVNASGVQKPIWLFSSSEAISNLADAMPSQSWQFARAICTHPRIAQQARTHGFGVVWASRPTLEDVVASIESAA